MPSWLFLILTFLGSFILFGCLCASIEEKWRGLFLCSTHLLVFVIVWNYLYYTAEPKILKIEEADIFFKNDFVSVKPFSDGVFVNFDLYTKKHGIKTVFYKDGTSIVDIISLKQDKYDVFGKFVRVYKDKSPIFWITPFGHEIDFCSSAFYTLDEIYLVDFMVSEKRIDPDNIPISVEFAEE